MTSRTRGAHRFHHNNTNAVDQHKNWLRKPGGGYACRPPLNQDKAKVQMITEIQAQRDHVLEEDRDQYEVTKLMWEILVVGAMALIFVG
jgi:hypothetical protein